MASSPTRTTYHSGQDRDGALSFEATVPRRLVHKRALGEVFLTGSQALGDDNFVCAGLLPRSHSFFNDGPREWYDPLLVLEAARQAGLLVSHEYLGVVLGSQFLVTNIYVTVEDPAACRRGTDPPEMLFEVTIPKRHTRDDALTGVDIDMRISTDGVASHTAGGSFMFLGAEQYALMREQIRAARALEGSGDAAGGEAADPALVARSDRRTVVISKPSGDDGRFSAAVAVEPDHPCLFDHPLDHVPGTALLEAYRQMAIASTAAANGVQPEELFLSACRARFGAFAEHELPIECEAIVGATEAGSAGGTAVDLTLRQPDMELSKASVELVPAPR